MEKKKIIVLLPSPEIRQLVCERIMPDLGLSAQIADGRHDVLSMLATSAASAPFDLLITNQRPESGFAEFTRMVKNISPKTRIIVFTGGSGLNSEGTEIDEVILQSDDDSYARLADAAKRLLGLTLDR